MRYLVSFLALLASAIVAAAAPESPPAMLKALDPAVTITPFFTTGDKVGEYHFPGTPDGLGAYDNGDGTFTLFVNHEWDKTPGGFEANIRDSMVSKLLVDKATLLVKAGQYVIYGTEGYKRFCSATLVGKKEGFPDHFFLTNEEGINGPRKGIVVAVDANTGKVTDLPQLGHFQHENTTAAPYDGKVVLISGEDFENGELYMLLGGSADDVLKGGGTLHVLQVLGEDGKPLGFESDFKKGQSQPARFVPLSTADNANPNALANAAADKSAFHFVRIEDSEYDKNNPHVVWFTTTGKPSIKNKKGEPANAHGNLWRLKLDDQDPTKGTLTLVLSADQGDDIHNPDNIATSEKSVMIQEDITDKVRFGRVVRYDLTTGKLTPVAQVVETWDGKPLSKGDWESSGIINAFEILGDGAWLLDVQAHTLRVPQLGGADQGGQLLVLKVPGS